MPGSQKDDEPLLEYIPAILFYLPASPSLPAGRQVSGKMPMRYPSYLNTACSIIESYTGAGPLSDFIKKFFVADKKYGSTDRKQITTLCYHYFRLGKAVQNIHVEERIILATFLCERSNNDFLQFHQPGWNDNITAGIEEKLSMVNYPLSVADIFPWKKELSEGIGQLQLSESYLQQPNLFLRIRPGKKNAVIKKLQDAGLRFELTNDDGIALPNASKLDGVIELDIEALVQDHNSQRVLDYLKDTVRNGQSAGPCGWVVGKKPGALSPHPASGIPVRPVHPGGQYPVSTWDCCAASGGKSILAYDILHGKVELTVSDIRESILSNLKKRFARAEINRYKSLVTDLTTADCPLPTAHCQLLICDAPCTGSGTWGRTPEQLFYFDPTMINGFAERQKKIVSKVIPQVAEGGLFFYITCSVFAEENERIAEFIKKEFHLQLLQMELLKGYDKKADTMFVAVFSR